VSTDRFAGIVEQYELWRAIDPDYDRSHDSLERLLRDVVAREWRNLLSTVNWSRNPYDNPYDRIAINILEIGCGIGHTSKRILDADPRIRLMAIDQSPGMVERAKQELASYGEYRFQVHLGDALELLPKISDRIDYVVAANTIHNLHPSDQQKMYHLIAEVLEYRGCFFSIDKIASDDMGAYGDLFEEFLGRIEALRETHPQEYAFLRNHEFEDRKIRVTEKEFGAMLTQAGFCMDETISHPHFDRHGMVVVSCSRLMKKSGHHYVAWGSGLRFLGAWEVALAASRK
jgi:ubiquinone/menaquinone biosynthesis C-methylase UbiE